MPPRGCFPSEGYPSSSRDPDGPEVPTIGIYYGYAMEIEVGDDLRSPSNDSELLKYDGVLGCTGRGHLPLPDGLRLLGKKPVGCRVDEGDQVTIKVAALYNVYRSDAPPPPDGELELSLVTRRERLVSDLKLFSEILSSIALCTPENEKPSLGRKPCPENQWW